MSLSQRSRGTIARKLFRRACSKAPETVSKPTMPTSATPPLMVSEVFRSVQGEGPNSGKPSVFLRLGVCNLSCSWCDTPYTWLYSDSKLAEVKRRASDVKTTTPLNRVYSKRDELRKLSVSETISEVNKEARDSVKNLVITGGEPLLHKKPLLHLLPCFLQRGFDIEFETNGTISPDGLPHDVHLNVSPKLTNSLMRREQRLNFRVLHECMQFPSSVLKFVVDGASEIDEVQEIIKELGTDPSRVYLMPQGTVGSFHHQRTIFPLVVSRNINHPTSSLRSLLFEKLFNPQQDSETIRKRGRWLVEVCLKHGFHYTHRIHVELWGDKRGV